MKKLAKYFNITKEIQDIIIKYEPKFVGETLREAAEIKDSRKRESYIKNTYGYNFKFKLVSLLIEIDLEYLKKWGNLCLDELDEDTINYTLQNRNLLEKIAFIYGVDTSIVVSLFNNLPMKVRYIFSYLYGLDDFKQIDYENILEIFSLDDEDMYNIVNNNYKSIVRSLKTKKPVAIDYNVHLAKINKPKVTEQKNTEITKKDEKIINDEDLINDIVAYYEAFGYKEKDIIRCCNRYNDILSFNYSKDYKLNNLPKTNTKKMALIGFITHIDGDLCQLIINRCKRDKKAYYVTSYNNESVYSLYVYYGKKGIPADIVDEVIHYLSEIDKGEMRRLFTGKKYLRKNDPKLSEFLTKFDYVINNIENIRKEKIVEEKKILSDTLNLSKKEGDLLYSTLTKAEKDYLITLLSYSFTTKVDRYKEEGKNVIKIIKLKSLCNIKTLLNKFGYENVCQEIDALSEYYDLSTGELKRDLTSEDVCLIEDILNSYIKEHESSLFPTYTYLVEYAYYLVKTQVLTYSNVVRLYGDDMIRIGTLFSVINKDKKLNGSNLSLLELLTFYSELMTCVLDYMEVYLNYENEYNLNKRIVNGNRFSVVEGYNKLKTL